MKRPCVQVRKIFLLPFEADPDLLSIEIMNVSEGTLVFVVPGGIRPAVEKDAWIRFFRMDSEMAALSFLERKALWTTLDASDQRSLDFWLDHPGFCRYLLIQAGTDPQAAYLAGMRIARLAAAMKRPVYTVCFGSLNPPACSRNRLIRKRGIAREKQHFIRLMKTMAFSQIDQMNIQNLQENGCSLAGPFCLAAGMLDGCKARFSNRGGCLIYHSLEPGGFRWMPSSCLSQPVPGESVW